MRGLIALLLLMPSLAFSAITERVLLQMKRLLFVIALITFLWSGSAFAVFIDFYCESGGSNLNSGTTTTAPSYTTAGGNWTNSTRVFTVQDSTNPSTKISIGDICAVYVTSGATTATFIGNVSNVQNATNGTVTFSTSFAGTNPSNGTGTMTLTKGGPWKGPNNASGYPLTLTNFTNVGNRINFKNDATYSITAGISCAAASAIFQGYSSTVGDGGKATIDAGTTNASIITANTGNKFIDLIIQNNATGVSNGGLVGLTTGCLAERVVVHGVRGDGFSTVSGAVCGIVECEVYDFNKANTASLAGINAQGGQVQILNNFIHDASGSNCNGIITTPGNESTTISGNIFSTLGGSGILIQGASGANIDPLIVNNDFYNDSYGIKVAAQAGLYYLVIQNNNFVKNTNYAIEGQSSFTLLEGIMWNNGYGAGTQANGGNYHNTGSIVLDDNTGTNTAVTYASDVTPWKAPTTGNFSDTLTAAQGTGRGHFEENDGTHTGTVGYPDIGAAQANIGCPYPTPTYTPTATPTPTATATATATSTATATATPTATSTATPTPTATATASYTPCAICSGISRARADNPQ